MTAPDEQAWFNGDHSAGTGSGRAWAKPAAGRSRRTSATLLCLSRADARIQAQEHADWPVGHAVAKRLGDDALATLRESLSNVVRNAEGDAGEVLVGVDMTAKTLTIRVEDNGVGIDPQVTPGGRNTAARARAFRRAHHGRAALRAGDHLHLGGAPA